MSSYLEFTFHAFTLKIESRKILGNCLFACKLKKSSFTELFVEFVIQKHIFVWTKQLFSHY